MKHSNFAFRALYHLIWTPSEHKFVPKPGIAVIDTNKFALSLGFNSFYMTQALEWLYAEGFIECIEVAHGELAVHWPLPYKPCGCPVKVTIRPPETMDDLEEYIQQATSLLLDINK